MPTISYYLDSNMLPALKEAVRDFVWFATNGYGIKLRSYQIEAARAIVHSVKNGLGLTFVVIFPRQSGKNEVQAHLEAYLLTWFMVNDGEIVKVSPTWKPQSQNAMRRLQRVLARNALTKYVWVKESGYIYRIHSARIYFLSGAPEANVVGATASTLLECDEAQDVGLEKWDKEFNPMAASANATRVFWGTAWTSDTLLHREKQAALAAEALDGIRRVFQVDADDVSKESPAYRRFVNGEIAKLGRSHPFVKTQYFSEEIEAAGGMFPLERRELMQGAHAAQSQPIPGAIYAFLLDVGGEEIGEEPGHWAVGLDGGETERRGEACLAPTGSEGWQVISTSRDSTALTVVQIELESQALLHAPTYRVVARRLWQGAQHNLIFAQLIALAETWAPAWIVCDATGVGAGLASFLTRALGEQRVLRFIFSAASKSKLGWDFLAVVETGRFKDYIDGETPGRQLRQDFWQQVAACEAQIVPGPGQVLRWGVPDGRRDPASGKVLHDDLLVSAALCALLDAQPWGSARSRMVPGIDPIAGMGEAY